MLAAALTVLTALAKHETHTIPYAAGADLYVQCNELDLDLTQIMLLDDSPALASQKLDGTAGYQTESDAIDADLRQVSDGAAVRQALTAYRSQATVAVVLGSALLVLLLAVRPRRGLLVAAAVVTLALMAASITLFQLGDRRARAAHDDAAASLAVLGRYRSPA